MPPNNNSSVFGIKDTTPDPEAAVAAAAVDARAALRLSSSDLLDRISQKMANSYLIEPLSKFEETQPHHLISIATDWTLLMGNRLAANCRNISDEVYPGIHLGDRLDTNIKHNMIPLMI